MAGHSARMRLPLWTGLQQGHTVKSTINFASLLSASLIEFGRRLCYDVRNIKDREKRHAPSMRGRGGLRVDGMIFNIQRFSLHDGPGIRTTVFLSGCNLRCRWCHNPESFTQKPVIRHFPMKCIGCAKCMEVCPQHCHISVNGVHQILRQDCVSCGKCKIPLRGDFIL